MPTDLLYSRTGYDVTNYFRSEVIVQKLSKCRLRRLRVEFLENGLSKDPKFFTDLSGTTGSTNVPDMPI